MEFKSVNKIIEASFRSNWDRPALSNYQGVTLCYRDVARRIAKLDGVKDAQYVGIGAFEDSAVSHRIFIYCPKKEIFPITRAANRIVLECLNEAGIGIELAAVDMPTLLRKYYAQDERDCDMILMGTNFQDVFDPSVYYDANGKDRLNGITDTKLADLARDMRKTDPEDAPTFVRKWIRFLEYRSEVLPEIPLYSNAYLDFFTSSLQNYYPGVYSSWSEALIYAYLGDYIEEEAEEEYELEEGEELFD